MEFVYQKQPLNNVCGQTVVAMIIRDNVHAVICRMRERKTRPADLAEELSRHGWEMSRVSIRLPDVPDVPAIFLGQTVSRFKLLRHWALWTGSKWLDPANPNRSFFDDCWTGAFYEIKQCTK